MALRKSAQRNVLYASCAARFLTKVVCASCIVPGCCAQVALCTLLHRSALRRLLCASALSKLLCASALRQLLRASALRMCSVQIGLCKLLCASALCKCSVQFAERKLLCASDSAQVALRKCCRSCGNVLRVLFLYLKVAIFQPELRECAPRTTFVLKKLRFSSRSCGSTLRILRLYLKVAIFQPELPEHAPRTTFVLKKPFSSRSCSGPGGNRIAKAGAQTTRQLPKAISRATKSHGATARALRHARSPQRVRRD